MPSKNDQLDTEAWIEDLVKVHVKFATGGVYRGDQGGPYFDSCVRRSMFRGITTIFTRDRGYHSCGWFKNPDFERCWHLTISYFDPLTLQPKPKDQELTDKIVRAFFTKFVKHVLVEPPVYSGGKHRDVWHYRLFCDEKWQPITPRGEVYSTEYTEQGWQSFSDVQEAIAETGVNPNEALGDLG